MFHLVFIVTVGKCTSQGRVLPSYFPVLNDNVAKNNKTRFCMFFTLIKHGFLTNQNERSFLSKYYSVWLFVVQC